MKRQNSLMKRSNYVQAKKKIRLPRIERDESTTLHEDENAHLWAVSYADFLMALMSFFILFYSADPASKSKIIFNLAKQFDSKGKSDLQTADGKTKGTGGALANAINDKVDDRLPSSLSDSLNKFNVSVDTDHESLIINFADNMYKAGQHEMYKDQIAVLKEILEKIHPFSESVNLYFEGHADNRPMNIHKTNIVVDNFVLSSLRASSALIIARDLGFSEKKLFIQAASSNIRNSRSLSIRIEPHKETL